MVNIRAVIGRLIRGIRSFISFVIEKILLAIVIPLTLATLSQQQQTAATALETERQQDGIVASYVKDMTDLMTNKDFNIDVAECGTAPNTEAESQDKMQRLIRGRSLLAFSQIYEGQLKGARSGQVLRFLVDSGIAYVLGPTDLEGRDFTGANLWSACLRVPSLAFSNFTGAQMRYADLSGTLMPFANLTKSGLSSTNMTGADLTSANLTGATLWSANMEGANLIGADFSGADLWNANLTGATLENAIFSTETILPDGTATENKFWTPDTDMTRYIDPTSRDFWQPDWVNQAK